MTVENIITIISVIAAISGIIFGAAAFARNKRDDNREDGSYRSDIGYIKQAWTTSSASWTSRNSSILTL